GFAARDGADAGGNSSGNAGHRGRRRQECRVAGGCHPGQQPSGITRSAARVPRGSERQSARLKTVVSDGGACFSLPTALLGRQRGDHRLEVFVGGAETPLELVGEITPTVRGVVEFVLVFDVHGSGVAVFGQDGKEALPIDRSLAGEAEAPP